MAAPASDPRHESAADRLWWFRSADEPRPPTPRAWWRSIRQWRTIRRDRLDALACLALASLWFSAACGEILFRTDRDFYTQVPLGAPVVTALALNVVGLAAVGFVAAYTLRRARRPLWRRLGAVTGAAAVLIALNSARLTYEPLVRWTDALPLPALLAPAGLALAAAVRWPGPALRAVRRLALVASPVAVVTLAFLTWMFLESAAGPHWRLPEPKPLARTAPSLRRVVWVVFEELDQRLAFEARPPGLELPELDRLRRDSLYADGARPPAGTTEVVLPALITGRPVVAVAPVNPNELDLTFEDGKTARWSAHANVFTRARTLGYDGALVGWRLPYPRVLGSSLGLAAFRPSAAAEGARGRTLVESALNQWVSLAPSLNERRLTVQRFEELGDLALRAATDGRFGLVLVHLPVPAPPVIYDRATGRLTPWSLGAAADGYLDNLALADRVLAQLRRGLERTRLDDRTWLIVTSDRWWRGSARYHGSVDHRVPFLVRPPDGGRPIHVDTAFSTLATHDLVLAILRGSIADAADAAAWLDRSTWGARGAPPKPPGWLGTPRHSRGAPR